MMEEILLSVELKKYKGENNIEEQPLFSFYEKHARGHSTKRRQFMGTRHKLSLCRYRVNGPRHIKSPPLPKYLVHEKLN